MHRRHDEVDDESTEHNYDFHSPQTGEALALVFGRKRGTEDWRYLCGYLPDKTFTAVWHAKHFNELYPDEVFEVRMCRCAMKQITEGMMTEIETELSK
jgi:hypothetical protein